MAQRASPTSQPLLIRLPPDLHQAIKARAAMEDMSMAQAIRRALRLYLEEAPKAS